MLQEIVCVGGRAAGRRVTVDPERREYLRVPVTDPESGFRRFTTWVYQLQRISNGNGVLYAYFPVTENPEQMMAELLSGYHPHASEEEDADNPDDPEYDGESAYG